jgi:uncharacterized iron-regulated protein
VLALEQLEAFQQPDVDCYAAGQISFDELAMAIDWADRWSNYEQYRGVLEAARGAGAPIVALNARRETVRRVGRVGVEGLEPAERQELPPDIQLDDPAYEQYLRQVMRVHAHVDEQRLRAMFEAQVTRDETMAHHLAKFLQSPAGKGRTAVVLCGAGHVSNDKGIPPRVRRRMPMVRDRVLVLSGSGDVTLTAMQQRATRDVTITHEQLRGLGKPVADYLHATAPAE